jgi:hypothetical protein
VLKGGHKGALMEVTPTIGVDWNDILELDRWNKKLLLAVEKVNGLIDRITGLKIILLDEIQKVPMNDRMSFENKIIKIRSITEHPDWVDDYIRTEAELRKAENTKDQIEEAIKSIKKKMEVLPR